MSTDYVGLLLAEQPRTQGKPWSDREFLLYVRRHIANDGPRALFDASQIERLKSLLDIGRPLSTSAERVQGLTFYAIQASDESRILALIPKAKKKA